ncbi:MAG: ABC transporter ATP-binding protein [Planctomycetes bacterium]|nr:ABC transporter ATP-binding protein [Planctomycetota bacterium]
MSDQDAVFRIQGLTRRYPLPGGGYLPVLRGVDLEVRPGELLVIQGRSGIGKSTLLHIMGLLDHADEGTLIFEGQDLGGASLSRRAATRASRIGFVFQFFYLLPEFTAFENVMVPGQIKHSVMGWMRHRSRARERALQVLDAVGLADRARHRPQQLSGGERQRVALARALFNEPAVLLCDEPTGNLDVKTSEYVHELLARLNRDTGQTMVIVTHDEAMTAHADRVVHIEDGRAVPG